MESNHLAKRHVVYSHGEIPVSYSDAINDESRARFPKGGFKRLCVSTTLRCIRLRVHEQGLGNHRPGGVPQRCFATAELLAMPEG